MRKGQKMPDEQKQKIRVANTGKIHTEEAKIKMIVAKLGKSSWNKGLKMERPAWNKGLKGSVRPNNGTFKKGHSTWNKGKKAKPESIEKSRLANLGKVPWNKGLTGFKPHANGFKKGQVAHNKGKKTPESVRIKQSIARRGKYGGDKCHLWRGGITPLIKQIRNSISYKDWRKSVFIRDDYTCIKCGDRGCYLHADHIKLFSKILSDNDIDSFEKAIDCFELWDISNGQTLCKPCHNAKTLSDKEIIKRSVRKVA